MIDYAFVLQQRRYLDLSLAVEAKSPQLLAAELRRAAEEHHTYEAEHGEDKDWASWYAQFMLGLITAPADRVESVPSEEDED